MDRLGGSARKMDLDVCFGRQAHDQVVSGGHVIHLAGLWVHIEGHVRPRSDIHRSVNVAYIQVGANLLDGNHFIHIAKRCIAANIINRADAMSTAQGEVAGDFFCAECANVS